MAHDNSKLAALGDLGQSVWLDFISRDLLRSGRLGERVAQGVAGMTTNPTIFDKAIGQGDAYDEQIHELIDAGRTTADIADALIATDVQDACDLLRPVYDGTGHADGYVSIEVPPALAYDTQRTVAEAHRLHDVVDRPNLMVKIPGTQPGIAAIRRTVADGLHVNVTLLFALDAYEQVVDAYFGGLEDRVARREPIDDLRSVASFFVSRVDGKADREIDELLTDRPTRSCARASRACAARSPWPTPSSPTGAFSSSLPPIAGTGSPSAAPTPSACSGRARAPRTRATTTCSTSTT